MNGIVPKEKINILLVELEQVTFALFIKLICAGFHRLIYRQMMQYSRSKMKLQHGRNPLQQRVFQRNDFGGRDFNDL